MEDADEIYDLPEVPFDVVEPQPPEKAVADTESMRVCPVCSKELAARSFLGHISAGHRMNSRAFFEAYPDQPPIVMNPNQGRVVSRFVKTASKKAKSKSSAAEDKVTGEFNNEEKKYFEDFVSEMFQQMDRDATQMPRLRALGFDQVILMRYQRQMAVTSNAKNNKFSVDKDLNTAIKELESRIDAKMKSLTLDRESKVKNRTQVKSTPGAIISGYMEEIERNPVDVLEAMLLEEEKALAEVKGLLDKYYLPQAAIVATEEEADYSHGSKYALDIESVIQRSGIEF